MRISVSHSLAASTFPPAWWSVIFTRPNLWTFTPGSRPLSGGGRFTFDGTHQSPRGNRIAIGYGRDAAVVALTSNYGTLELNTIKVTLEKASRAMSWLHIIHETTYPYKKEVRFWPHRLVFRPREGHDVHIEEMRVEMEPEFEMEWSRDLFGNCVATAHILSPADRLHIRNEVLLHQTAPFPRLLVRRETPTRFPVQFSEMESVLAGAYLASSYPT